MASLWRIIGESESARQRGPSVDLRVPYSYPKYSVSEGKDGKRSSDMTFLNARLRRCQRKTRQGAWIHTALSSHQKICVTNTTQTSPACH